MDREDFEHLVSAYIERYEQRVRLTSENVFVEQQDLPNLWVELKFQELGRDDPSLLWNLILCVLSRTKDVSVLSILAAGPLEDLIEDHGGAFIERIEFRAETDADFRDLLHGVWRSSTPEIWNRIVAARGPCK
jgi:hypothetical protein